MATWQERMAWDLDFAGRAERTQKVYLADVRTFSDFHGKPLEQLGQAEVRSWVEHLITASTSPSRLRQHLSALVFLFRKTLTNDRTLTDAQVLEAHKGQSAIGKIKPVRESNNIFCNSQEMLSRLRLENTSRSPSRAAAAK